tara:strand:- start:15257 stop:15499 length:243 start_codon:yes stop_codon:yes gene_type:complete
MTKKKCCKAKTKKEHDILYVQEINQFHCSDNEIYLTVEYRDDDLVLQEKTIIFDAFEFLHSGVCDKSYIKNKVLEYVKEI